MGCSYTLTRQCGGSQRRSIFLRGRFKAQSRVVRTSLLSITAFFGADLSPLSALTTGRSECSSKQILQSTLHIFPLIAIQRSATTYYSRRSWDSSQARLSPGLRTFSSGCPDRAILKQRRSLNPLGDLREHTLEMSILHWYSVADERGNGQSARGQEHRRIRSERRA